MWIDVQKPGGEDKDKNRGDLRRLGMWIDVQKPGGEDKDNRLREGEIVGYSSL